MEMRGEGVPARHRGALTVTALAPAAVGLLGPLCSAGRLSWLGPALVLPVGLWLCLLWRELGLEGLPLALERAFGQAGGWLAKACYLLWALALLTGSAGAYAKRTETLLPGSEARWFFLLAAAAVSLWLSHGRQAAFARAGRLFFLALVVATAFALALAAPSLDWQNLWPPERTDPAGALYSALLSLSLAGYGVYGLCLPVREGETAGKGWAVLGSVGLAWLLLTVVGIFGPALAAEMKEPFLMALQGVAVPGAFRRGEAALAAVLTLGDFALLALLSWGCARLWEGAASRRWAWGGCVLPGVAILAAGLLPGAGRELSEWLPAGNLIFGVAIPALAVLGIKVRRTKEEPPIFSALKTAEKADVGEKFPGKKSPKENEKKC